MTAMTATLDSDFGPTSAEAVRNLNFRAVLRTESFPLFKLGLKTAGSRIVGLFLGTLAKVGMQIA